MDPVVHFEIPYKDTGLITKFYNNVFGWKYKQLGPDMDNYILLTTAETDAKPGEPAGTINGGMFPYKSDWPRQYPSIVIAVADIHAKIRTINHHGGQVLGEPMVIPNIGFYVAFLDPEGSRLSILQPNP